MQILIRKTVVMTASLLFTASALASHDPPANEVIEYDGSAVPGPVSGAIGFATPNDNYDWYCASATSGQEVQIQLTRTSGDILLNTGVQQGIAQPGQTHGDLPAPDAATANDTTADVTLTFTPSFSGPFTIFVSTWLEENGGDYSMQVTGAESASCASAVSARSIPAATTPGLILLSVLLGLFGIYGIRKSG